MWNGVKPVFRLTTTSGRVLRATGNHPVLTPHGWCPVEELQEQDDLILPIAATRLWTARQLEETAHAVIRHERAATQTVRAGPDVSLPPPLHDGPCRRKSGNSPMVVWHICWRCSIGSWVWTRPLALAGRSVPKRWRWRFNMPVSGWHWRPPSHRKARGQLADCADGCRERGTILRLVPHGLGSAAAGHGHCGTGCSAAGAGFRSARRCRRRRRA